MTSAPPPGYQPPPARPELPAGVTPAPGPWPSPPLGTRGGDTAALPPFAPWMPFAALMVAYALAILVAFVIAAAAAAGGAEIDSDNLPTGIVLAATLVQDALLVAFAVMFARVGGAKLTAHSFGFRLAPFWRSIGLALLVFAIFYGFAAAWSVVLDVTEQDNLAEDLGAKDATLNLIAVAALVALAAPLAEELFFRGFLFPALWRWQGWIPAAIISGIVFGLVHAGGTPVVFLVPLAVLGFLLCWLYRATGSLLPGMGVHSFNNSLALGWTLHWELWQILLMITLAPALVVFIASRIALTAPAPAPA